MNFTRHIDKAISLFGSQQELAKAVGVTQKAVSKWRCSGSVPPKRALKIEEITNGVVKRYQLCDLFFES